MKAIKARLSKFSTVDEFVEGWGSYYFSGGLLLPTRNIEPAGATVSMHIQIATGDSVLRGEGTVEEVRTNSAGKPVGMVIRFTKLDANSKEIVRRILDYKKKIRTSPAEQLVQGDPQPGLTDQATGENLAASELGAIADELEETFDSIFSGSFLNADSASQSGFGEQDSSDAAVFFGGDSASDTASASDETPSADAAEEEAAEGPADEPGTHAGDGPVLDVEVEGFIDEAPDVDEVVGSTPDEVVSDEAAGPTAEESESRPPQTPPVELQPENRVSSFIDEVTGAASSESAPVLTHEDDAPKVTSLADAAAKAAASAAAADEAFDVMMANATMSTTAAEPKSPLNLPVRARRNIIDRFIDWLKDLFG